MLYDFATLLDDMPQPMHRSLVEHWLELYRAAGNRLPPLTAVDPIRFGRYLPDICILDHDGGDRFVYRLSGGNVDEFYGRRVKGCNMADLVETPTRERLIDMAQAIISLPAAVLHGLSSMLPQWNYSVALTRISLPLADAEGVPRHIISATQFLYDRSVDFSAVAADYQRRYRIPLPGAAEGLDLRSAG